jgi:hypothetical protein
MITQAITMYTGNKFNFADQSQISGNMIGLDTEHGFLYVSAVTTEESCDFSLPSSESTLFLVSYVTHKDDDADSISFEAQNEEEFNAALEPHVTAFIQRIRSAMLLACDTERT